MEVIYQIFKDHGWMSAGWIVAAIAIFLLAKNYNGVIKQLRSNVVMLSDVVTELRSMVKVQQEQIDNQKKTSADLREDLQLVQREVFTVNYKRGR
jgi:hypothetical protein